MDVKSDFIHGDIHEEIYMQHPEGFIHDPPGLGMPRWTTFFYHKALKDENMILMCILRI